MKKVVVKLDLHDDEQKQKAISVVSCLKGIDSIKVSVKDKKLTVVGDVDPVDVVKKLRKYWYAELLTVGTAKEEGKRKEEPKKEEKKMTLRKDAIVTRSTAISHCTKRIPAVVSHTVCSTPRNNWELKVVAMTLRGSGNPPRIKRV